MSIPSARQFLRSDHVLSFLEAVGIETNPLPDNEVLLEALSQVNPRYKGKRDLVRFQLESDTTDWPIPVQRSTRMLAERVGMMFGDTPLRNEFDLVVALGGARRSPLHRLMHAVQAIRDGKASSKVIVVAGSTRKLDPDPEKKPVEKPIVQDFAPGAETEYDLCVGACETILARFPELDIVTVCEDDPKSGNDGVIKAIMQACKNGLADKYGFNVDKMTFAGVTTQIYVRGLHYDLARNARIYGWTDYFAAGHASDPEMIFNRTLATYNSECLTTIRKAAIAAAAGC